MTALIVIASIILFFAIILNIKIRAEIGYTDGRLDIKVKYLFFTIYPMKRKDKRRKRNKKTDKKNDETEADGGDVTEEASDAAAEKTEELTDAADEKKDNAVKESKPKKKKEKQQSSLEKLGGLEGAMEKIKIIWGFSEKKLKRLFKHICLEKLVIDFIIAGEDAHKTAVTYGAVNAAVYNTLSAVRALFKVTVKKISIVCDFERKEPVYDCGVRITIRPSVILSAGFGMLWGFLRNYSKIMPKKSGQPEMNAAVQV